MVTEENINSNMCVTFLYFALIWTFLHVPIVISGINNSSDNVYGNVTGTACIAFELDFDLIGLISVQNVYNITVLTAAKHHGNPTAVDINDEYKYRLDYNGNLDEKRVSFCLRNLTINDSGVYRLQKAGLSKYTVTLFILRPPTKPILRSNGHSMVGSSVILTCDSHSQTSPPLTLSYIWTLNGSVLENGTKHIINHSNLQIVDITKADRTNGYRCISTENKGHFSTSDIKHLDPYYPPEVRLVPYYNPYNVTEGSTFIAEIDANPPNIAVSCNGGNIQTNGSTIFVSSVTQQDGGYHNCNVSNGIGIPVHISFHLNVQFGPKIVTPLQNQSIEEGSPLSMTCNATGNPLPSIVWTRNRDPAFTISGNQLYLPKVYRNMNDTFTCRAENILMPSGLNTNSMSDEESVDVNVLYGPGDSIEILPFGITTVVQEGSNLTISCQASCNPHCSYKWSNVSTSLAEQAYRLTFENVNRSQAGIYVCEAWNDINGQERRVNAMTKLVVHFGAKIVTPLQNQSIEEGSPLSMTCNATGKPLPSIVWTRNRDPAFTISGNQLYLPEVYRNMSDTFTCRAENILMPSGLNTSSMSDEEFVDVNVLYGPGDSIQILPFGKTTVVQEGSNLTISCQAYCNPYCSYKWSNVSTSRAEQAYRLTFKNVNRSQAGIYVCEAWNYINGQERKANSTTKLEVHFGPKIVTPLQNQSIEEGSPLSMTCNATGNPLPSIVWTRHSHPEFEISGSQLYVSKVYRNMSDTFICRAENILMPSGLNKKLMSDEIHVEVDVLYGPGDSIHILPSGTITVVQEGLNMAIICQASCNPYCSYKWSNVSTSITDEANRLTFQNVSRSQAGIYVCEAWNDVNGQARRVNSKTRLAVHYQPSILNLTVNGGNEVMEGSSVVIRCNVDSEPKAKVEWKRNNHEIISRGSDSMYTIQNATCQHTANYTCVADNGNTKTDSRTIELYVTCSPRPNLKPQDTIYVKPGDVLNATASVFAYPPTNATWHFKRNTSDLETKMDNSSRVTIVSNNILMYQQRSTLRKTRIVDSDFGEYTVLFQNRLGVTTVNFKVANAEDKKDEKDVSQSLLHQTGIVLSVIGSLFLAATTFALAVSFLIKNGKSKNRKKNTVISSNDSNDSAYCEFRKSNTENVYETIADDGTRTVSQHYENACFAK